MRPRTALPVALLAAVVGAITVVRPFLPMLTDTSPTGGVSLLHLVGLLGLLLNPGAVFLLGRRVGCEYGVAGETTTLLGGFVATGVAGVAVGSAVAGAYVFEAVSLTPPTGLVATAADLLLRSLLTGVPFGIAGFAGAAWAALRTGGGRSAMAP
ncbi:hypothetical protein ACFO0N_06650 [Halobium salinum]|uniref:Energy-coupling factor transport system substrate-specific component n=1 Tax=Halobium salinum TaxID=1364940 RepID=A0ABD5PA77_9EURY|nr:hypothetical protein [Halobium salinum]